MHLMRMYDKATGNTIALFHSISLALECVKLSWKAYPNAAITLDINGVVVARNGFEDVEYGFEPMRVITAVEHL